jgi:drug/metabolite transporter (DMT)-like permease
MSQEQSPPTRGDDGKSPRPAWIAGGVLILIGIVFIVRNVMGFSLDNWWALFILIPALGSLVTSWQMYGRNGRRFTRASRGPLIGGLFLLGLTAVFFFKLDWSRIWPFVLILAGLGVLLGSLERKDDGGNRS